MNHISSRIKTLIFDLGGVIVDLAPEKTLSAFAQLSKKLEAEILSAYTLNAAFNAYETGRINEEEFRNSIREMFGLAASDIEIDRCWNAMLTGIAPEKLMMLTRLKKHFTTLILSNTNSIHLSCINEVMLRGKILDTYVDHAYYSHLIGMRKPNLEIFEYVLKNHSIVPEETLFLDDNADNILAAKALRIETVLIEHPSRVIDLFKNYG